MNDVLKVIGTVVVGLILIAAVTFALNGLGLVSLKFWGPKYEEGRRQIVQQSIRRQEGVSEGIGALCLNMRLEKDLASKSAFANLIVQQATATGTQLTPDAQTCVSEAQRTLGI